MPQRGRREQRRGKLGWTTGNTAKQEAKVFARNLCIKVSALNYLRMKRSCTESSVPNEPSAPNRLP
jgi:hypothetical protein